MILPRLAAPHRTPSALLACLLLCGAAPAASFQVFFDDHAGFAAAAGAPDRIIDFDDIAPGTDITGQQVGPVTFTKGNKEGAPLIVVRGLETETRRRDFIWAIDPVTNRLFPTSGENVLSPGGTYLGPGPNPSIEDDSMVLAFAEPLAAVGFDLLYQEKDCCSSVAVSVYGVDGELLYANRAIPTGVLVHGGGAPGGAEFVGFVSQQANIQAVRITEYDNGRDYPDSNIGYDTIRICRTPHLPVPAAPP